MRVYMALERFMAAAALLLVGMVVGSSIPLSRGVASTDETVVDLAAPSDEAPRKDEPVGSAAGSLFRERLLLQAAAEAKRREQRHERRLAVIVADKTREAQAVRGVREPKQLAGLLQHQDAMPRESSLTPAATAIAQSHGPVAASTIEGVFAVNKVLAEGVVEAVKTAAGVPPVPTPSKKPEAETTPKATDEKKPPGVVGI